MFLMTYPEKGKGSDSLQPFYAGQVSLAKRSKNRYSKTCLKRPLKKKTKIGFQFL